MTRLQLDDTIMHPRETEKAVRLADPNLLQNYTLENQLDKKLAFGINNGYMPDCEELLRPETLKPLTLHTHSENEVSLRSPKSPVGQPLIEIEEDDSQDEVNECSLQPLNKQSQGSDWKYNSEFRIHKKTDVQPVRNSSNMTTIRPNSRT